MNKILPGIVVTGASGFIGRHFVIAVSGKFRLFCIARRRQKEAGIPPNDNTHWLQADITKWKDLLNVFEYIKDHGGADYVLHLAGYYDFTQKKNSVYEQVNVTGTRYVLDLSKLLGIKRFIFSSSLAACKFPPPDQALTEESSSDADFPYARSKRRAEAIIKKYAEDFPCSIVRLAAVYSDWCEYPMLYMLLRYWLSKNRLMSKIVTGQGQSAVPYIHVKDLIKLFLRIIEISGILPSLAVYNASPQGSVSHNELFKTATRYYHGHDVQPFRIPKILASLGLVILSFWGWVTGKETIEKSWMAEYIDKQLNVDASKTFKALGWKPTPRYHILRRLLFLTENMISHPNDWRYRNELLLQKVAYRKSTMIYDILTELRESIVEKIVTQVMRPENERRFSNYRKMYREMLIWNVTLNYQLIASAVKNRDRSMIPNYAKEIAFLRYSERFEVKEVKDLMMLTGKTMEAFLLERPELRGLKQRVDDYIILTSQLAADELEDTYETLEARLPEHTTSIEEDEPLTSSENLKQIIQGLENIQDDSRQYQRDSVLEFNPYGVSIKLTTKKD